MPPSSYFYTVQKYGLVMEAELKRAVILDLLYRQGSKKLEAQVSVPTFLVALIELELQNRGGSKN